MPRRRMGESEKPRDAKKTAARLLRRMGAFKFAWAAVFACVAVSAAAQVAGIYFIKPALNYFIIPLIGKKNPDMAPFAALLAKALAVFLAGAAAAWANALMMVSLSTKMLRDIRVELFCKMQKLPIKFFDSRTRGEIMSRFTNDMDTLRETLSQTAPQLLSSALTVAGILAMMAAMSLPLTAMMIATTAATAALSGAISKKSAEAFRAQQKNIGDVNSFTEEIISGQKTVKVFTHEKEAETEFERRANLLRESGTRANSLANALGPIANNLSHVQYALIAMAGALLAIAGRSDIGSVAAFLQYTRMFGQPVSMISQQAAAILNALAGAERIFEMMDETAETDEGRFALVNSIGVRDKSGEERVAQAFARTGEWSWKNKDDGSLTTQRGDIVFDHVTFGYREGKTVLRDICIHAKPGQKIALIGSTGSGKTTIINLLTRFYDVPEKSGEILYDGIPVKKIEKDSLRKSLGMVLQDTRLFTGTIRDNIRYGNLDASDAQVEDAARLAGAHEFIARLERGYDTMITGDGSSLSQGQRQLIAIARAAAADPPALILDEATSSIDTRTEKLIEKGMDALMKGRTVFVIAHRLSAARRADEIITLEGGRIIERGTHDCLMAAKGRYWLLRSMAGGSDD